jgi:HAD superfamily hydrolase (TIGR01484 family)
MNYIFSDFDGTLTDYGHLGADFVSTLETINHYNHELIVVSGRSLSWGHFLLTHFPMNYCVMEGGGVVMWKDKDDRIRHHSLCTVEELGKLRELFEKIKATPLGVHLSDDSYGRLADRAFELDGSAVNKEIEQYLIKHKANYYLSTVHINFWYGNFDKYIGIKYLVEEILKHDIEKVKKGCLYFGDGMNDVPVFDQFSQSIGVSNLAKVTIPPKVILKGEDNREIFGVKNFLQGYFSQKLN